MCDCICNIHLSYIRNSRNSRSSNVVPKISSHPLYVCVHKRICDPQNSSCLVETLKPMFDFIIHVSETSNPLRIIFNHKSFAKLTHKHTRSLTHSFSSSSIWMHSICVNMSLDDGIQHNSLFDTRGVRCVLLQF